MDLSSFVAALTSALQDSQVRACLSDIVGESFRQELISLKAELKQKDSVIKHLDRRIESLESQNDALEQYTRRNSIRVTGLPEVEHEDILDRTLKIVNEDLEVNPPISIMDIDRVHRVGRRNPDRPRAQELFLYLRDREYLKKAFVHSILGALDPSEEGVGILELSLLAISAIKLSEIVRLSAADSQIASMAANPVVFLQGVRREVDLCVNILLAGGAAVTPPIQGASRLAAWQTNDSGAVL
ncbi:hypothetical protein CAPTEDRAFT_195866 [Capitella teleta]|uniref:Uncharacterized protein n=1 Tax=Capitella teleta TaxID=283909 RepID=R7VGV8_CAPTE|nr:hypothetical protein CAPTEDRAFT_195866 [Capitella teleta]|eukprot:ELU18073.1 hypothetical protein CAPTEDRAFT_195866 [Capitella teleta]